MVNERGWCPAHDPEREAKRLEAARKGGQATARKLKRKGLEDAELPPLVDAAAAEAWCDTVGRACVTGRIGHNEAKAALRAVREWRESHEAGRVSERLEALMEALDKWRETGDPQPVLELVN